jgi:hypothetical protein
MVEKEWTRPFCVFQHHSLSKGWDWCQTFLHAGVSELYGSDHRNLSHAHRHQGTHAEKMVCCPVSFFVPLAREDKRAALGETGRKEVKFPPFPSSNTRFAQDKSAVLDETEETPV